MNRTGALLALLLLIGGAMALPLSAQGDDKKEGNNIDVEILPEEVVVNFNKEGVAFDDFVNTAAQLLDVSFVFDGRKFASKTFNMIGKKPIKKEDLFSFFQTIFFAHDMAVVSLGPPEAEVLLIEDIKSSQLLKQRAVFVDVNSLEERRKNVGEIVATTIQLKHIPVDKAQRALNNIIQEHRAGFVHPIEESNSLLVTNFAPTVWSMYQIIQAMDVEVEENQLNFEKLALEYHLSEELATTIDELIQARSEISSSGGRTNTRNRNTRTSSTDTPRPKIIADGRTNSLLVYAVEEDMREIKMLVGSLDVEGTELDSNIHIYELKNTNAEDMQETLSELLEETNGARSTRARGTGGTTTANRDQTDPDAVKIVADAHTNALLITSTQTRFEEISEIIARLDKKRPQVLVQCAIAELTDNDLENIGVEVAQIEGGGDEARFFGGSAFGLSTIVDNGTGTAGGDGGGDGNGGGTSDMFFDDLVRIPNLDAQGLTAGIFQDFVGVPLLVQLFQQRIRTNLVSVPSVLVNDNEEARIIVGSEIPTTQISQGQFSDQNSFAGYQEANLELSISPQISNDNYLRLDILLVVQAFLGAQVDPSVPPPRTTREIETQVTVQSGRTVVIGGLTSDNENETVRGIPYLSDIPILGELFKSRSVTKENTTLYIFITPTILTDFETLDRISYERKLEIAKLEGQVELIDPNFRELSLDDEDVTIEEIESTGSLNLPRYRPSSALQEANDLKHRTNQVPVKPIAAPVPSGKESSRNAPRSLRPNETGRRNPDARPARAGGF